MRRTFIIGGLVAAIAAPALVAPGLADARTYCEQRSHDRKVAGTLIGAVGGALVGSAISHKNGALIGGLGGAVVGNQVARTHCRDGRAYYRSHTRTRHSYAARADRPAYETRAAASCRYETRAYYDERGQRVYAPTQVCR